MKPVELWYDAGWWFVRVGESVCRFESREEAEDYASAHA
jgi:hypothetical protein